MKDYNEATTTKVVDEMLDILISNHCSVTIREHEVTITSPGIGKNRVLNHHQAFFFLRGMQYAWQK